MNKVIEYLKNPMKTGVYNRIYLIEVEKIINFLKKYTEDVNNPERENIEMVLDDSKLFLGEDLIESTIDDCILYIVYKNDIIDFYKFLSIDEKALKEKTELEISQKEHLKYADKNQAIFDVIEELSDYSFESRPLKLLNDVITFDEIKSINPNYYSFSANSLKENTLDILESIIKKTPHINETFKIIKRRLSFSSRYVFRPYACAVKLWCSDESSITVPKDLLDLISTAAEYYLSEEWRTSIILSSIVVESILADIFEEKKKEDAPDVPLGALFQQVRKMNKIPEEIISSIESVNKARISAVHRSKSPVSDRDAAIALYGTTTTTMWFADKY